MRSGVLPSRHPHLGCRCRRLPGPTKKNFGSAIRKVSQLEVRDMRHVAFAVALCVVSACASTASSTSETGPARNPDVITADELALPEIAGGDALQAVQRLRPRFLISRGMTSASNPAAGAVHV